MKEFYEKFEKRFCVRVSAIPVLVNRLGRAKGTCSCS